MTVEPRSDATPDHTATSDESILHAIEVWFVERGVPHFIERSVAGPVLDAWTRALPLLVVSYLLLGLNALDLSRWTVLQNVLAALAVVALAMATWIVSNRLRGQRAFTRPRRIDKPELALFLIAPTLPALALRQFGDALQTVISGIVLLIVIYVWTAYGAGPLLRWALKRSKRQVATLASLLSRALPLLLLFNTFLFINAEVWEMAGTLTGPVYGVVLGTFFLLGAAFALSRVPGTIRAMNTFDNWDEVRAKIVRTPAAPLADRLDSDDLALENPIESLRLRQRLNIGLVVLFGQALQITLVTVVLTVFFAGFGFVAITEATTQAWTRLDDVNVLLSADFGGRVLVLTEPHVRVACFLSAFSGMYFTVLLATDDTYRSEFSDEFGPEVREALAVRAAYRVASGKHGSSRR